jgi:hypothetical protein
MKKFILPIIILLITQNCTAQADSADYYKAFLTLPSFKIHTIPDSSAYTNNNLDKHKPIVIMFFSPDCEHCQHEAQELVANKEVLKDVPILMLSIFNMQDIINFYDKYNLKEMPNVTVGQDYNFNLGVKFKMQTFPAMYVYNEDRKIVKAFVGNVSVSKILNALGLEKN